MKASRSICFTTKIILFMFLISGWFTPLKGEETTLPKVKIRKTAVAPLIDGKLDDACWKDASKLNFVMLGTGGEPKGKTEGGLAYDDDFLYVGFKCYEPDMKQITATADSTDIFANDDIEFFLNINKEKNIYYQFAVNPLGTKSALLFNRLSADGRDERKDWHGYWQAKTQLDKDYWTVEMAVPFASLNIEPDIEPIWRINLNRSRVTPPENSSWAPMEGTFHAPDKFGLLEGLEIDFSKYRSVKLDIDWGKIQIGDNPVKVILQNMKDEPLSLKTESEITGPEGVVLKNVAVKKLASKETGELEAEYIIKKEGQHALRFDVKDGETGLLLKCAGTCIVVPSPLEISLRHTNYFLDEKPSVNITVNLKESALNKFNLTIEWKEKDGVVPLSTEKIKPITNNKTEVALKTIAQRTGDYLVTVKLLDSNGKTLSSSAKEFSIVEKIW